jgi:hypothetical protein
LAAVVLFAAAAGIVLRAVLLGSTAGTFDADDGAVGLMVKHAAQGHIPLMFWGQNYGGTQEVLLTAPLFLVTGTSAWALRAVPFVLVAVTAVLVWRIALRTSNSVSAIAAAALFWVAPAYLIYKTSHQHGFYASGLVWAAAILLLVLRLGERDSRRDALLLGLALGLAWWQTPQIVTVAVPAVAWLMWYRPAVIRHGWPVVPAALIGMAPWIVWNAGHQWSSVTDPPGSGEPMTLRSYVDHVRAYVSSLMPMNLGLRTPFTSGWPLGKIAAGLIYAALLIAFARLGWRRRRQPISLLVVVTIAYPLMYALSPAAWNANEPRYALLSLPALAVLLAYPLRTPARVAAGVAVAVALTGLSLTRMDPHVEVMPGVVNPRHYGPLIAELDRNEVDRVYADYWIAYRLTFETDERIIAAQSSLNRPNLRVRQGRVMPLGQGWSRNWSYNRAVDRADRAAIVFTRADPVETDDRALLVEHGYRRHAVGPFVVYLPPDPLPR